MQTLLRHHAGRILAMIALCVPVVRAGDPEPYAVSRIPAALRANARAVVRLSREEFTIRDIRRATYRLTKAVTIFDKDKRDYGVFTVWYDKYRSVEEMEATIYDADGKEVKDLDSDEIRDFSEFSGANLFSDNRVKAASIMYDRYPYTVEFRTEVRYNGSLNWPTWYAQESDDAVERSEFIVTVPAGDSLRFFANRDSVRPVISGSGDGRQYTWTATGLPALSKDAWSDDVEDVTTVVRIAPRSFMMDDIEGSMETWRGFGAWEWKLIHGRDVLPPDAVQAVRSAVDTTAPPRERARAVYHFLQQRSRYISVQLGIGGWQPMEASVVHDKGYGDCKALSNYAIALLRAVGVPASPVLVRTGNVRTPMITAFPSNQFDHMIVCVPFERDSVWLECTSRTDVFGVPGAWTSDRPALLIDADGGHVVRIPATTLQDNVRTRVLAVRLIWSGDAEVRGTITARGAAQEAIRSDLADASPEEQKRYVLDRLWGEKIAVTSLTVAGMTGDTNRSSVTFTAQIPRYGNMNGPRLFVQPAIIDRQLSFPAQVKNRLSPLRFSYPYRNSDSIVYRLPDGYGVEALPGETDLATDFGAYRMTLATLGDTAVVCTRTFEIRAAEIPASAYGAYRTFLAGIVKADRGQMVLIRRR